MNGMDAKAFFDDWREGLTKEEKEMTKAMEREVGRIYEELTKWCTERGVVYEYHYTTDEGESCTFITSDTTLTINHVENRDPEQFSRYVKSVLFGVDNTVDNLKELVKKMGDKIDELNKEILVRDDRIAYLQCALLSENGKVLYGQVGELEEELKKLRDENAGLKYQLDTMNTKILELNDMVIVRDKDLNSAADKIIQLTCANTTLKSQIDGLRLQLKAERKSYEELKKENAGLKYQLDMKRTKISELQDAVREKVRGIELAIDRYVQVSCANTRLVEENVALKTALSIGYIASKPETKQHDDAVDSARYLMLLGKKKRAEEMIRSLKKQVDDLNTSKLQIMEDDLVIMDQLKKKNTTLQYKVDALENDVKDLTFSYKKELEKKEKENLDLDNNVKDMWATLRSLKKENAGLKDANSILSVKLEKLDVGEAKKDVKEKQEIIDTLKNLDERIAWMEDHMSSNENDVTRSMEKLEEDQRKLFYDTLNIFTRLGKLEDAQSKESAKKTSKKTQKSITS